MDVNSRNLLFSKGEIERGDLWPKITEYRDKRCMKPLKIATDLPSWGAKWQLEYHYAMAFIF